MHNSHAARKQFLLFFLPKPCQHLCLIATFYFVTPSTVEPFVYQKLALPPLTLRCTMAAGSSERALSFRASTRIFCFKANKSQDQQICGARTDRPSRCSLARQRSTDNLGPTLTPRSSFFNAHPHLQPAQHIIFPSYKRPDPTLLLPSCLPPSQQCLPQPLLPP